MSAPQSATRCWRWPGLAWIARVLVLLALVQRPAAQHIEPEPYVGDLGDPVVVSVWTAEGQPWPGVEVDVVAPDGQRLALGSTDGGGKARFVPTVSGMYELRATPAQGPLLLALHEARASSSFAWRVVVCVPLGLLLLGLNLARWRRSSANR